MSNWSGAILGRPMSLLRQFTLQQYVNALLVGIGLTADLISLSLFFGAINTSPSGSNFYVNSREFLAWLLLAVLYSLGIINAYIRRRWRTKYGGEMNHSVLNLMWATGTNDEEESWKLVSNFQRDFSFMYVQSFLFTFLFSRAISASEFATSLTPSPWGDIMAAAGINIVVALAMMVVTSMFDFSMSMFVGETDIQSGQPRRP